MKAEKAKRQANEEKEKAEEAKKAKEEAEIPALKERLERETKWAMQQRAKRMFEEGQMRALEYRLEHEGPAVQLAHKARHEALRAEQAGRYSVAKQREKTAWDAKEATEARLAAKQMRDQLVHVDTQLEEHVQALAETQAYAASLSDKVAQETARAAQADEVHQLYVAEATATWWLFVLALVAVGVIAAVIRYRMENYRVGKVIVKQAPGGDEYNTTEEFPHAGPCHHVDHHGQPPRGHFARILPGQRLTMLVTLKQSRVVIGDYAPKNGRTAHSHLMTAAGLTLPEVAFGGSIKCFELPPMAQLYFRQRSYCIVNFRSGTFNKAFGEGARD